MKGHVGVVSHWYVLLGEMESEWFCGRPNGTMESLKGGDWCPASTSHCNVGVATVFHWTGGWTNSYGWLSWHDWRAGAFEIWWLWKEPFGGTLSGLLTILYFLFAGVFLAGLLGTRFLGRRPLGFLEAPSWPRSSFIPPRSCSSWKTQRLWYVWAGPGSL